MDIRLDGKVAIVTGASRGIGRAVAEQLAADGASVLLASRKHHQLERAVAAIGGDTTSFVANVNDDEAAAACVAHAMERWGHIDFLVNNAATNPYRGPAIGIDTSRYEKTMAVNLRAPLVWSQLVHRAWMAANGGVIVNIASAGAFSYERSISVCNTTKAAPVYLTKALAAELGPSVRVNAVAPGLVKTEMARALWEHGEEKIAARFPMDRLGEPDDIADAVLFLLSERASWITGQTLAVDGGILASS